MPTHGLRCLRSDAMIVHFFGVSYDLYGPEYLRNKANTRDRLLAQYR